MNWWEFAIQVVVAVITLFLPGALLAWASGINHRFVWLLAPLFTVGSAGFSAIVLGIIGVRWSILSFAAIHLAVSLAVFVVARVLVMRRRTPSLFEHVPARTVRFGLIAAAIAAIVLTVQLLIIFGRPDSLSQSYDNIFHLNAVRQIANSGDASSLTLNGFATATSGIAFYPGAWHGLVALVFDLFPQSIPASTNAMTVAVAAFAWPASMAGLAIALRPKAPVFVAATTMISSVLVAFPGLMIKWGILYPNLLGFAVMPAFLALTVLAIRAVSRGRWAVLGALVVPVLIAASALVLSHPNTLVSSAALVLALSAVTWLNLQRSGTAPRGARMTLALVMVACVGIWAVVRPIAEASVWPEKMSSGQAAGEFLTNSFNGNYIAVTITLLVGVGVWLVLRTREFAWIALAWAGIGVLWIMVVALRPSTLRWLFTGPWYSDSYRIGALAAVPTALLAGIALAYLASRVRVWFRSRKAAPRATKRGVVSLGAIVVLVALALNASPSAFGNNGGIAREFRETKASLLITTAERKIIDKIDDFVAPDEVIASNPWDGSAVVFALEDRRVLQLHTLGSAEVDLRPIQNDLRNWRENPEVCDAVREGNVRWYLRLEDTLNIGAWAEDQFDGYVGVTSDSELMTPVLTQGDLGLYKIVGCG